MEKQRARSSGQDLQCTVHPLDSLGDYIYVVICSFYKDKIILSRQKRKQTWETQGGHIEAGETPWETARRELSYPMVTPLLFKESRKRIEA